MTSAGVALGIGTAGARDGGEIAVARTSAAVGVGDVAGGISAVGAEFRELINAVLSTRNSSLRVPIARSDRSNRRSIASRVLVDRIAWEISQTIRTNRIATTKNTIISILISQLIPAPFGQDEFIAGQSSAFPVCL